MLRLTQRKQNKRKAKVWVTSEGFLFFLVSSVYGRLDLVQPQHRWLVPWALRSDTHTRAHTHTHTYDSLIQSYHSSRVATEMAPRNDKKKRKHWDKWHRHYKKEAICLANDDSPFGTGSYRQLLSANDNTVCSTPNGKTWGNINKSKHSRLTAIALIRSSSSFVFPHRVKGPP